MLLDKEIEILRDKAWDAAAYWASASDWYSAWAAYWAAAAAVAAAAVSESDREIDAQLGLIKKVIKFKE